jgi:hypothetical protein
MSLLFLELQLLRGAMAQRRRGLFKHHVNSEASASPKEFGARFSSAPFRRGEITLRNVTRTAQHN